MSRFRVGAMQACGLEIYVFDPFFDDCPAFEDDYLPFPGTFDPATNTLTVNDGEERAASARLNAASNSADDDKDRPVCEALGNLALRIARAERGPRC